MLKIGENLKKFRLKRELTQEQLSDIFGVSAQSLYSLYFRSGEIFFEEDRKNTATEVI